MAGLSAILFYKNGKIAAKCQEDLLQAQCRLDKAVAHTDDWWMRSLPCGHVGEDWQTSLGHKRIGVCIVFNEASGCGSCLQLEATEWQAFLDQDSLAEKVAVHLVCTVRDVARQRQEFRAMRILFPICYDSTASVLKDLDIPWTPHIF